MLTVFIYLALLLVIVLVFGSAVYASFRAAPWLPSFKRDIARIIKLANVQPGEVVYDLGSGDGRILVALANATPAERVVGYEVSLLLYIWSRVRIAFLGLSGKAEVRFSDFYRHDLSQANVIFCFLTPRAMKRLGEKFRRELRPGTRIISYSFSIPGWKKIVEDQPVQEAMPIHSYVVDGS